MIFTSLPFLIFFPVVFVLYWGLGLLPAPQAARRRARIVFILLASYFFYACWDWRFLFLIFLSTLVDFLLGAAIHHAPTDRRRKTWVIFSVAVNLGFLGFFKYFNFFLDQLHGLSSLFGLHFHGRHWNIILPIGISFYTFQSLSYTIDIYRRKLAPERNFLDFAFFISFFPHIVAGPIVRAADFLHQTHKDHRLRDVDFDGGFELILKGMAKKVLISDYLAAYADRFFAGPAQYGTLNTWLGMLAYAMQIYCDFSGYTDIAIGCARLLGYELMRNFDYPYLARGFSDFWRRWHISLSVWLRDYLYISLGGNRCGRWKTYRNLMLTMLLGGLWHGAAYTFIIWGGLHGILLCLERMLQAPLSATLARLRIPGAIRTVAAVAVTFLAVDVAWVFFRAATLADALTILRHAFWWKPDSALAMSPYLMLILAIGFAGHLAGELRKLFPDRLMQGWDLVARPVRMLVLAVLLVLVSQSHEQPFIYFQF